MTRANGNVAEIEFRVWDVARCRALLTKSYRGGASDMPRLARRIADDVVEAFTGKRGVASTEIAFVSTRSGHPEITVMDALGGNQRGVTKNKSINAFPSWSPDGNAIVYMSYVFRRSPHLFRLVRGGSEKAGRLLENLDVTRAVYRGVYAPNGARLAAVISIDGAPEIFSVDVDGRNLTRLTNHKAIDLSPTWSPDGARIAFVSDRTGSPQLYLMNADGSGQRRLSFDGSYNTAPAWSPDGRWIAYETRVGGQFDIWLIDPEGRTNVPLVTQPAQRRGAELVARFAQDRVPFAAPRQGRCLRGRSRRQESAPAHRSRRRQHAPVLGTLPALRRSDARHHCCATRIRNRRGNAARCAR